MQNLKCATKIKQFIIGIYKRKPEKYQISHIIQIYYITRVDVLEHTKWLPRAEMSNLGGPKLSRATV